jgi:hypothetical protein
VLCHADSIKFEDDIVIAAEAVDNPTAEIMR